MADAPAKTPEATANPNQYVYDTPHTTDLLTTVMDVYFAEKVPRYKWDAREETYTVKNAGKAADIKKKYEKENRRNITSDPDHDQPLKKGDQVKISWEERTADGYEYRRLPKAIIKKKVFLVASCTGKSGKLTIEILENKLSNPEQVYDAPVKILVGDAEQSKVEFTLNDTNTYALEIGLRPKSDEDLKKLVEKFNKRQDKNAFLYFKAEVSGSKDEIKYPGDSPEIHNKDGERFEIIGTPCYCNRDITVDEMIDLIYELRDKQQYKSMKESFFNKGTEFIAAIRVTSGKISENRDKLTLFTNEMNAMFKKFNINTCKRKIHFLGQMYLETISFMYTYESRTTVPDNYKGGVAFQGRGMKQITHDYNYLAYYDYVNKTDFMEGVYMTTRVGFESVGECAKNRKKAQEKGLTEHFYEDLKTFAKNVSQDLFHAFNSAGWFSTVYKTETIAAMDKGLSDTDVKAVTKAINGGDNNLAERQNYTKWVKAFFKYDTDCINR